MVRFCLDLIWWCADWREQGFAGQFLMRGLGVVGGHLGPCKGASVSGRRLESTAVLCYNAAHMCNRKLCGSNVSNSVAAIGWEGLYGGCVEDDWSEMKQKEASNTVR